MDTLEQARAMFFSYLGNHSHMLHDGVIGEYRRFRVSREQERQWVAELLEETLLRVQEATEDEEFVRAVYHMDLVLFSYRDAPALRRLLEILSAKMGDWDSFTLLAVAERVLNVVKGFTKAQDLCSDAKGLAQGILLRLLNSPLRFADCHRWVEEGQSRLLSKDDIVRRARSALAECAE